MIALSGWFTSAAVAPDAGETVQSQLDKYPTPIFGHIEVWPTDGSGCSRKALGIFAGEPFRNRSRRLSGPPTFAPDANLFNQKVYGTAWKTKPSWSIVATEESLPSIPTWNAFLAKRMGAKRPSRRRAAT